MFTRALMSLLIAPFFAGCGAPSLNASTVTGNRVADPGLAGEWIATEPMQIFATITAKPAPSTDEFTASLTVTDKGTVRTSVAVELGISEIGGARYADLFLARSDRDRLVTTYGFLAVPVHQIMRIERAGDALTVRPFRAEWLRDRPTGDTVSHERVVVGGGEVIMITAPATEVHSLLADHANDPQAFGDPIVFHRVKQ